MPPITVYREETHHIVFIIIITCVHEWPAFQTPRAAKRNVYQHASEWKGALVLLSPERQLCAYPQSIRLKSVYWFSTGFASSPRFYIGYQAPTQFIRDIKISRYNIIAVWIPRYDIYCDI